MNKISVLFWAKKATFSLLLFAFASVAQAADVNFLQIGDSITNGFNSPPSPNNYGQTGLSTYRPYIVGTVSNYLNEPTVNPSGVTWSWLGNQSNAAQAPPSSPIALTDYLTGGDGDGWANNHEGHGGSSAQNWSNDPDDTTGSQNVLNQAAPWISPSSRPCENVAMVLLGTNDLQIGGWSTVSNRHTWNHQNPMDVIHYADNDPNMPSGVYGSTGDGFNQGYIPQVVELLRAEDPNMDIFISAIPPVDQTQDFTYGDVKSKWFWTEKDKADVQANASGSPINGYDTDIVTKDPTTGKHYDSRHVPAGVNGGVADGTNLDETASGRTDTNDVIDALNLAIEEWVAAGAEGPVSGAPMSNITFIDPRDASSFYLVDVNNTPTTVAGGPLDLTESVNPDLADGLHLSYSGDQKYAAAFWHVNGTSSSPNSHSNLQECVSAAAFAAAVPEPSSFLFLGLIATAGFGVSRFRKQDTATVA